MEVGEERERGGKNVALFCKLFFFVMDVSIACGEGEGWVFFFFLLLFFFVVSTIA